MTTPSTRYIYALRYANHDPCFELMTTGQANTDKSNS